MESRLPPRGASTTRANSPATRWATIPPSLPSACTTCCRWCRTFARTAMSRAQSTGGFLVRRSLGRRRLALKLGAASLCGRSTPGAFEPPAKANRSIGDLNFLPGGAKYGDLPGMLALGAPGELWLAGEGPMGADRWSAALTRGCRSQRHVAIVRRSSRPGGGRGHQVARATLGSPIGSGNTARFKIGVESDLRCLAVELLLSARDATGV